MKKKSKPETESPAFRRGKKVREHVLGKKHVERATGNQTELDADFQALITETAWGAVWARPGLDLRTRHLITIGLLAGLGRDQELKLHLSNIENTGTTWDDVRETLMHVAIYAGIPAANSAIAVAKQVLAGELQAEAEHG